MRSRNDHMNLEATNNPMKIDNSVATILDRAFVENSGKNFSNDGHRAKIYVLKKDSINWGDPFVSPMGQKREANSIDYKRKSENTILKARSKNIIYMPINTTEEVLIEKKEFIGNLIEKPCEGLIRLIVVNTRENEVLVRKCEIKPVVRYLKHFNVIKLNKSEKSGAEKDEI